MQTGQFAEFTLVPLAPSSMLPTTRFQMRAVFLLVVEMGTSKLEKAKIAMMGISTTEMDVRPVARKKIVQMLGNSQIVSVARDLSPAILVLMVII